ncbi:MAG: hypothetical protein ACXVXW_10620, partial [Mycobacteriaceae bacterium]
SQHRVTEIDTVERGVGFGVVRLSTHSVISSHTASPGARSRVIPPILPHRRTPVGKDHPER